MKLATALRKIEGAAKVVAWVEPGLPDLEFDGRTARPGPDHPIGVARGRAVTVVLRRPARVARTQRAA